MAYGSSPRQEALDHQFALLPFEEHGFTLMRLLVWPPVKDEAARAAIEKATQARHIADKRHHGRFVIEAHLAQDSKAMTEAINQEWTELGLSIGVHEELGERPDQLDVARYEHALSSAQAAEAARQ